MRWVALIAFFYLLLGIAAIYALSGPAAAATCLKWPQMQIVLAERYGEGVLFVGRNDGADVEVVVAGAAQGTWTALVRKSDGTACVLATGDTWAMLDPNLTQPLPGTEN